MAGLADSNQRYRPLGLGGENCCSTRGPRNRLTCDQIVVVASEVVTQTLFAAPRVAAVATRPVRDVGAPIEASRLRDRNNRGLRSVHRARVHRRPVAARLAGIEPA